MFSNSTYDGVGSWGDPANDNQISTGGFKNMTVAYPAPHHIRRNFVLQPFLNVPGAPPPGPLFMINTTFTKANVDYNVGSFTGDFIGFQAYLESIAGAHPALHIILGGDMSGQCPFGLTPPACFGPGMTWSPNGECDSSEVFTYSLNGMQTLSSTSTMRYVLFVVPLGLRLTWTSYR